MNERERRVRDEHGLEEPARLNGETLLGCLGIGCILFALLLFGVSFDLGYNWITRLAPLMVFSLLALGVGFIMRVPAGIAPRSHDPRHPLTRTGTAPLLERPATNGTRASLGVMVGLVVSAGVGYVAAVALPNAAPPWGLFAAIAAGIGLWTQALLIYTSRAPAPALNWQRLTPSGVANGQIGALIALGLIAIGSSLLLALMEGFGWGEIGLAALLVALVGAAPLARRAPIPSGMESLGPRSRRDVE